MTMADELCDVCHVNLPIGVASTMVPYSCAYCRQCLLWNAQPDIVFETWYDDVGVEFNKMASGFPDSVVTFQGGAYISYRQWALRKAAVTTS